MSDETAGFPEAWRPEAGDKIAGCVQGVTMGPDFGYGPYPILTLVDETGAERAVHAMHQILRTELARRRPGRGDEIEITYVGKRPPKSGNGNPFHVYRVSGGKEPEFNWDNELPAEERQAPQQATAAPPIAPSALSQPEPAPAGEQFGDKPPF